MAYLDFDEYIRQGEPDKTKILSPVQFMDYTYALDTLDNYDYERLTII